MTRGFPTLAWKIPWTEEPGGLQSMGSLSWTRLSDFTFTFHFHALEKEMATHSSVLAWRIPGTGEPGGLLSMGSRRVGHDWSDLEEEEFNHMLIDYARKAGENVYNGFISNAVQPSHPLMPYSLSALSFSQHQGLFQWVVCSHQMTKILALQLQHQCFQWIF